MYLECKVVYGNDKSFNMKIASPDRDEFLYELLTTFKDAECRYNPDDYGQFTIKYVEVEALHI